MCYQLFAYLRFSGDRINADLIDSTLCMQPSTFVKAHTSKNGYTPKVDSWIYRFDIPEEALFEDAMNQIKDIISPIKTEIKRITDSYDGMVWISIYPHAMQTNYHIRIDIMGLLCQLGLSLDISSMHFYDDST